MANPDIFYVTLITVGFLFDHFILWPTFLRKSQVDPARASLWIWSAWMSLLWALVAAGVASWLMQGRPWGQLGLNVPEGWRLWVSSALLLALAIQYIRTTAKVAGSAHSREKLRGQFGTLAVILPHTRVELYWFVAVSLTAGFCEEFLFRGYLIWTFAPWLGWWGAASLSVAAFAAAHAYQGASGILRTGILGVLITLVVALFGSLWPAVALHALLDIGSGIVAWLALREEPTETGTVEAEKGWR